MREGKRKDRETEQANRILCVRRDEIQADVFELWIGISRLMERVSLPGQEWDGGMRGKSPPDRLGS